MVLDWLIANICNYVEYGDGTDEADKDLLVIVPLRRAYGPLSRAISLVTGRVWSESIRG